MGYFRLIFLTFAIIFLLQWYLSCVWSCSGTKYRYFDLPVGFKSPTRLYRQWMRTSWLGFKCFCDFIFWRLLKITTKRNEHSLKSDLVNIRVHELNISKIDPFLKLTQLSLFIASNVICFRDSRIKSIYFVNNSKFDYKRYPFISCIVVCIGIYANTTPPLFESSCINNTYILKWHEVSKSFYNKLPWLAKMIRSSFLSLIIRAWFPHPSAYIHKR